MTASTDKQQWQAGEHLLNFDPASEAGKQILDLFRRIKLAEKQPGNWASNLAAEVGNWFQEAGFNLRADAPTIAAPGHVFVPYCGKTTVLGSAHRSPWLAESFEQATLPIGERPDVTPAFLDLDAARRWIRWFVAEFPQVGRTVEEWEIREVAVKKMTSSDSPWTRLFTRNAADWSYQTSATRYPAVAPTRENPDD